jgi:hypothetical protein
VIPDPTLFDSNQLGASVLAVVVAASACGFLMSRHKSRRALPHRVLCVCALVAMASWLRFGALHVIHRDEGDTLGRGRGTRVERHQLFQFHEFYHYYLGAKYMRELGYLGLYDCTALADEEIAAEDGEEPHIRGIVRDLGDVLENKTSAAAVSTCRGGWRGGFSAARWDSFKRDIRELRRLVLPERWNEVVNDKGFNPSPSFALLASAVANAIPIRARGAPTYLLVTALDMLLLLACFMALRSSFGATVAVLAAVYFGASFLGSFGYLGGAVLRFTWVAAVVLALAALRRGLMPLSGALLAWAACERIFPLGFALGAVFPLAFASLRSASQRRALARFAVAFLATVVSLVVVSAAVFGAESWRVFSSRLLHDRHVHSVLHVGLEKILAYRTWVPDEDFRVWNLRVDDALDQRMIPALLVSLAAALSAARASVHRRPFEGALLFGIVVMFLASPASYYFAILAVVPALIFRSAATAPREGRRRREHLALTAFNAFWMCTLVASRLTPDVVVYDLLICVAFAAFLVVWVVAWSPPRGAGALFSAGAHWR